MNEDERGWTLGDGGARDEGREDLSDPVLLRVPVVARRLSIGRSKVYDLIDQGQLRRVKLGRVALVPAIDVETLVARLTSSAR